MKKNKLTLRKDIVRSLSAAQLGGAQGGVATDACNTLNCQSAKCDPTPTAGCTTVGHG